jgi:hypothetical protein
MRTDTMTDDDAPLRVKGTDPGAPPAFAPVPKEVHGQDLINFLADLLVSRDCVAVVYSWISVTDEIATAVLQPHCLQMAAGWLEETRFVRTQMQTIERNFSV